MGTAYAKGTFECDYSYNPNLKVGKGGQGTVYKCKNRKTHAKRAVKIVPKNPRHPERIESEIKILKASGSAHSSATAVVHSGGGSISGGSALRHRSGRRRARAVPASKLPSPC